MSKIVTIIIIILAVILIGAGYFIFGKNQNLEEQTVKPAAEKPSGKPLTETKTPVPTPLAPAILSGYKLYKNSEFGFEIQYPESFTVTEEINENVRGEMVKEYFFRKPNSDLRFAILPRDGLSYGVGVNGTSTKVFIGGSPGIGTQYVLEDGRRLWLLFPQYRLNNWLQDLGRIDAMTTVEDPAGDTQIFEQMLNSFKFLKF